MFEKKTWEDRITENPGRRKLINVESGEQTTVDVSRYEGNVSRTGTSFSASNMNDLENRIYRMFPCSISNGGTGATIESEARKNLDVMHAAWLYNNESGSAGTINLLESVSGYTFLDIYYIDDDNYHSCARVIYPYNKQVVLTSISYSPIETIMYIKSDVINISENTIVRSQTNSGWMYSSNSATKVEPISTIFKITQVIGYSY